jgi:hypothetical protein
MKKLMLIVGIVSFATGLVAQTTNLGGPYSWSNPLISLTPEIMPSFNQSLLESEDILNDQSKDAPWRFGYKYNTDYNLSNSGEWTYLQNGDKVWRIGINCPGALTVNLLLEDVNFPDGAYLYMYDVDETNRVGAYTKKNNRTDGLLGTELVHGENVIVEYYEPANVSGQGTFTISNVIHGYRSLTPIQSNLGKALNSSGNCNIDVNCPLGNGWENQIRSVAMIVVGGSGICTGALINNNCDDGTPYFLTADHCLGGSTGNWSFRFNWESPPGTESCATTANSTDPGTPYDQTANGATIQANSGNSDYALLLIDNMTITDAQNWNCFYAGWDNSDAETVTQATGVHHPSGDLKKICREDDAPYHDNAGGASVWWIDEWEQGVTEPGSSGSPLFDQNGRIIGQLYGGLAACSGTSDNNQYDYYGRFGVSWNNGASSYLTGSCGSTTTNDGYDPNVPLCNGTASSSTVEEDCFGDDDGSLTVTITGGDGPFTYNIGGGAQGSGTFTDLQQGTYTITVIDNNSCSQDVEVTLDGPAELTVSSTVTDLTCAGTNDGEINVNANGGTAPLDYNIGSGGQASSSFPNLPNATYTVTVTDDNNCITTENNVVVAVGPGVTANLTITDASCNGASDGSVQVVPTNGIASYTYDIGGGAQAGDTFTGLSAGGFSIDIVDGNACTGTVTGTIGQPSAITGSYTVVDELNGNDGSINITIAGGTWPYTYSWTGTGGYISTVNDPNNLAGGVYNVTVTDANGCTFDINNIVVLSSVGFDENDITFNVYPNPSNGQFNLVLSTVDNINLSVVDVTGRTIHQEHLLGDSFYLIDLSDKADGTYFIKVLVGGKQIIKPIVIEK